MARHLVKSLSQLRSENHPRLHWLTIKNKRFCELTMSPSPEEAQALDTYFHQFASEQAYCLRCGGESFVEWGIAHGETQCTTCGYPSRLYHKGLPLANNLCLVLQYHPDEVKEVIDA